MSEANNLKTLQHSAHVVVFHSPVTDLAGLDDALDAAGESWRSVEMSMGSSQSRNEFARLKSQTGCATLPQVFVDGQFIGGLREAQARLQTADQRPPAAAWMGYLGLLPFFATALGVWVGPVWLAGWLVAYAAIILSFIGAIHWGIAITQAQPSAEAIQASVVPALIGWAALLVPPVVGLPVLALCFVGWRVWESRHGAAGMPRWFRHLRTALTVGAVMAIVGGWMALLPFTGKA